MQGVVRSHSFDIYESLLCGQSMHTYLLDSIAVHLPSVCPQINILDILTEDKKLVTVDYFELTNATNNSGYFLLTSLRRRQLLLLLLLLLPSTHF